MKVDELRAKTGQVSCGCDSTFPLRGSIGSEFPQSGSGDEVALKVEVLWTAACMLRKRWQIGLI
jgi:hypothetical protein